MTHQPIISVSPDSSPLSTRDLRSFTADTEKKILVAIARRLPSWIGPDHLTALGAVSLAGAGLCYRLVVESPLALLGVNVFLFLNWFGDSLDGTVARVRGKQRPRYGFFVDHLTDAFGATFLLGGLAWSGIVSPFAALAVLIAYLLLQIHIALKAHATGVFQIAYAGIGGTEARLVLCLANLVLLVSPAVAAVASPLAWAAAALLVGLVLVDGIKTGRALDRQERSLWSNPRDRAAMRSVLGVAVALMLGMPGVALAQSPSQPVVELGAQVSKWTANHPTPAAWSPRLTLNLAPQTAGSAPPPAPVPAAWRRVKPGREVWVTTNTGSLVHGEIAAISDSSLNIREQDREVTIRLDDVRLVEGRDSIKNGLVIGGASGGLAGGVLFSLFATAACESDPCDAGGAFVLGTIGGAAVGGLLGAMADWLVQGRQALFSGSTTVVTPVITPTKKAVDVAIRWR